MTQLRSVAFETTPVIVDVGLHEITVLGTYVFLVLMRARLNGRSEAPFLMVLADRMFCEDKHGHATESRETRKNVLEKREMRKDRPDTHLIDVRFESGR